MTHPAEPHPWVERLSEYIDGEMSPDDARSFEAHLSTCPSCSALTHELQRVVQKLRTESELSVADDAMDAWPSVARQLSPRTINVAIEDAGKWARRVIAAGLLLAVGAAGGWWVGRAQCRAAFWPAGQRALNVPVLGSPSPTRG